MMRARRADTTRSRFFPCGLILVFGALVWIAACSSKTEPPALGSPRRVTIGIQVSPAMTLAMVAKDAGFFAGQGLDVELKQFTAGKFALQAFLGGSVDFAISGDVPVCLAALQGNQIRVVGQVVDKTVNEVRMVALRGVNLSDPASPEDYFRRRKMKLATSFGGGPEFFTYNFLRHHQIRQDQVELLSQRPEDMPAALETHSVDVISIFDPFAFIAEKRLGNRAMTFTAPDLYSELYVLNARPEQVEKDADLIKSVLRALMKAEDYVAQNPDHAKQIMQNYTKLDRDVIDGIWGNYSFKVSLNQRLIDYWNEEAIWARETAKVTPQTKVPDFQNYVEKRFLKELKDSAVRL
jgi:sulfonate transport system substrate-binding protein